MIFVLILCVGYYMGFWVHFSDNITSSEELVEHI